jgi:CRP-like cAMP-binding protein/SAM-dependent methyltransferase
MKDLELFRGWRESSIDWVLDQATPHTHISETLVVAEGSRPEAIYVVAHGLYGASVTQGTGRRQELGRLSAGAVFGEMAWLSGTTASATVRAIETSEALVLPVAALDARLLDDPAFAAEFMGSLARLLAQRLRATNASLLRHSEAATVLDAAQGEAGVLQAAFTRFKELASRYDRESRAKEGLAPETGAGLEATFDTLNVEFERTIRALDSINPAAAEALGAKVQSEFLPYLLATQTAQRFFTKPRGYAGDFMSIEHMYDRVTGGNSAVGGFLDEILMRQAAPEAVRNRRGVLGAAIARTVAACSGRARIMSLACGPARELFDVYATTPPESWPRATLLDIDSEALKLVGERLAAKGLAASATLVQANLIRLALGREQLDVPPQDLVYSIGLIDYFNDEFVVRLLEWIHARLVPGGRVILGNFHPDNPVKAIMDYILEWKLIHRTEDDMRRLFAASPFGGCSDIVFEAARVNLFAEGTKAAG